MNARQARKERRAAERKAAKLARKPEELEVEVPSRGGELKPKHSATGPRTPEGKNRSKRNAFKHGLYAKDLVLPGESPAELNCLRETLRAEHQPVNETEEILVNEIAEHFWRLRRMRQLEARGMQPENLDSWFESGLLALVARNMASAERGLHKAIAALRRLQLDRGFVPSINTQAEEEPAAVQEMEEFVPSFCHEPLVEFEQDLPPLVLEDLPGPSYNPLTCHRAA